MILITILAFLVATASAAPSRVLPQANRTFAVAYSNQTDLWVIPAGTFSSSRFIQFILVRTSVVDNSVASLGFCTTPSTSTCEISFEPTRTFNTVYLSNHSADFVFNVSVTGTENASYAVMWCATGCSTYTCPNFCNGRGACDFGTGACTCDTYLPPNLDSSCRTIFSSTVTSGDNPFSELGRVIVLIILLSVLIPAAIVIAIIIICCVCVCGVGLAAAGAGTRPHVEMGVIHEPPPQATSDVQCVVIAPGPLPPVPQGPPMPYGQSVPPALVVGAPPPGVAPVAYPQAPAPAPSSMPPTMSVERSEVSLYPEVPK